MCTYCKLFEPNLVLTPLEIHDHMIYECKGWGRAFDTSLLQARIAVPKSETYHLMLDKEFWEAALEAHPCNSKSFHTHLTCSAPPAHLHMEDMDDAHYWEAWKPFDMANRKFVFYRDWVNVGWFLHMNPMAGTFA